MNGGVREIFNISNNNSIGWRIWYDVSNNKFYYRHLGFKPPRPEYSVLVGIL